MSLLRRDDVIPAQFFQSFTNSFLTRRVLLHDIYSVMDKLRVWARRAVESVRYRKADAAFRPGGSGYFQARSDFMVRAGQRRATRQYRPY